MCLFISENTDEDTFRRLSALSPYQVAELCEQANTVAVHLQMAADKSRTTRGSSAVGTQVERGDETLDDIQCPELMQTDDSENSPDLLSTTVVLETESTASRPPVANSPMSQTKGNEALAVKRGCVSATKENKPPKPAAVPSTGRNTASGVSKVVSLSQFSGKLPEIHLS